MEYYGVEINAITLGVSDMDQSVDFYGTTLGLPIVYGGAGSEFTSFAFGTNFINVFVHGSASGSSAPPLETTASLDGAIDPGEMERSGTASAATTTEEASSDAKEEATTSKTTRLVEFWGRVVFHVDDPDAIHDTLIAAGVTPDFEPRDAPWGERYFHVKDPDGHELSFARPLGI